MIKNKNKKKPRAKYALGSFVENNESMASGYHNAASAIPKPGGGQVLNTMGSMAATGGKIGSLFGPGVGTAIGVGIGAIGGAIFGAAAKRREQRNYDKQIRKLDEQRGNETQDLYESSLDINNENPYGVYAKGGDIATPVINIEKGELEIDPSSGKILRSFKGINPENGLPYSNHKKKGKDTDGNFVTATEGNFIITKKEASKYKDAVDNNDKLYQNSIKNNIRNHKASVDKENSEKYALGSDIVNIPDGMIPAAYGVNGIQAPITPPPTSLAHRDYVQPISGAPASPINYSGIASAATDFLPSLTNIIQGLTPANQMPFISNRMNVAERQKILSDLPSDVSVNPALSNIRRNRSQAYSSINKGSSNPSIARANKLALENSFVDAENKALYENQLINNDIGSSRANTRAQLAAQDEARSARNAASHRETLATNLQMDKAKTQQMNYGLSQAQQMIQARRTNKSKRNMQQREMDLIRSIFPALGQFNPEAFNIGG